jgi:hypothetical protein
MLPPAAQELSLPPAAWVCVCVWLSLWRQQRMHAHMHAAAWLERHGWERPLDRRPRPLVLEGWQHPARDQRGRAPYARGLGAQCPLASVAPVCRHTVAGMRVHTPRRRPGQSSLAAAPTPSWSQIRQEDPLNLSISLSGGEETNQDSPSNGE